MDKQLLPSLLKDTIKDADIVCYCFQYSKQDIENDYLTHDGRSTILERIVQEKRESGCNCVNTNPKGR